MLFFGLLLVFGLNFSMVSEAEQKKLYEAAKKDLKSPKGRVGILCKRGQVCS